MDTSNTPSSGNKVPFDPGWNDPPTLSYNSQQTTPNRPRNFLNKRVAFPLSGNSPAPVAAPMNMPPMPTAGLPFVPPTAANSHSNIPKQTPVTQDMSLDSENVLKEVKGILLEFLNESIELGPKANDIKRRLDVMEETWISGKLSGAVQSQMKDLSCALRDNEPSKADNIHRALMVDHVSAVGPWMPGVKQLVHHCIARSELLAIDAES